MDEVKPTPPSDQAPPDPQPSEPAPLLENITPPQPEEKLDEVEQPLHVIIDNFDNTSDAIARKANKIQIGGLVLQLLIAVATFYLLLQTIRANELSKSAVEAAQSAVTAANEANEISLKNLANAEISDSLQNANTARGIRLSEVSVAGQLQSIREQNQQFELDSRAILTVTDITLDTSSMRFLNFRMTYNLVNAGKFPAVLHNVFQDYYIGPDITLEALKNKLKKSMFKAPSLLKSGAILDMQIGDGVSLPVEVSRAFFQKKVSVYLYTAVEYSTFGFQPKYRTESIYKLNISRLGWLDHEMFLFSETNISLAK